MKKILAVGVGVVLVLTGCSKGYVEEADLVETPTNVQKVDGEYVVTTPLEYKPGEYEPDTLSSCFQKVSKETEYFLVDNEEEKSFPDHIEMGLTLQKANSLEEYEGVCVIIPGADPVIVVETGE